MGWLLKRQRHLQQHLVKLGVEAELVPLLRAEVGALKGNLHALRDVLVNHSSAQTFLMKQFERAKLAEQQATTLSLKFHILKDDPKAAYPKEDAAQISTLRVALEEACDEQSPVSAAYCDTSILYFKTTTPQA